MNIGVSGMNAYQAQIDVISNNIANVGTTAYKSQNLSFQDLLYQTQRPASGPTATNGGIDQQQIGLGVKVGSTDTNNTQGGVQTTGVNTNMMINGDGYFIMQNSDGTGAPRYTRNGDFTLNQDGLLYDPSSGLGVMGYTANAAGIISNTGSPGPIQIPIGLRSQAVATGAGLKAGPAGDKVYDMQYTGNLQSSQWAAMASNGGVVAAAGFATVGTTIYDSLGNAHVVQLTFQPVLATPALPASVDNVAGTPVTAATAWQYNVSSTDGTLFDGSATSPAQYAYFDQNGQFINTSGGAGGTPPNVHSAGALPTELSGDQLNVTQWGVPAGANNAVTGPAVAVAGKIGIDLSGITSLGSASAVSTFNQNGVAPGTLSNMSVGQDGTITGSFTNGQSITLARVAVATFQNQNGMTRIGSSQYVASADSGAPQIGTANTGRFGAIAGNSLEMSNVSIAEEFTKLITAQNAFTANSKSITTANNDLQTVIGLIR